MNVLFLYPVPPPRFQIPRYQQGIGSISAVLKQAGHATSLLYLHELNEEELDRRIRSFQPGLVALSVTSGFCDLAREAAGWVSARHQLPVVLGGVHPTLCPEESIAAEGVFAICRGEGEYPMVELCEALQRGRDPTRIANLWVRANGTVRRNELRPLIADLDALPFPDREIFPYDDLLHTLAEAEFMGSRGCPFPCTYCVNHALIELYRGKGPYVRYRSVDNLLAEIGRFIERYPNTLVLGFHDDTFTLNPARLREFAEKYPARFLLPFWCNATAPSIDEETAQLLRKAGCYEVRIGIESGNDRIRREVLKKNVTRDEIVRAFRLLHAAGIQTYAFNMVGLPYETPAAVEDTIRLNQEVRPREVFCSIFQPYPGTELHRLCLEKGWFSGRTVKSYFEDDCALDQPSIRPKEVLYYHGIFREVVRWPRAAWIIRLMARVPVTRGKTLWNVFRRLRAKGSEFLACFRRPERR